MASQSRYYAQPSKAIRFAESLLVRAGLTKDHANLMAHCLAQADTRGVVCSDLDLTIMAGLKRAGVTHILL